MSGPAGVSNTGVAVEDLLEVDVGLVDEGLELGNLADLLESKHLLLLVAVDS